MTLLSVCRVTPSASAPSVTDRPKGSRHAVRILRPGWGGFFIGMVFCSLLATCLAARGRTTQKSRVVTGCAARPRWFPPRASSGRVQPDPRNGLPQVQQKAQESEKHLPSTVFQLARRARTQQLAQDQAQVERADMN